MWRAAIGALACLFMLNRSGAVPFQDLQIWTDVTVIGWLQRVAPKLKGWLYWAEAQGRFGNDATTLSQGILRPGLVYALSREASVWLGCANVPTMQPFLTTDHNEQRVWEQFLWTTETAYGGVSSGSRLEQRFRPSGSDVGWRFRAKIPLSLALNDSPGYSRVLSEGLVINVNRTEWTNEGCNQNRLFAGISYRWDQHTRTEIGYMNQFTNRDGAPNQLHHILSLAVHFGD